MLTNEQERELTRLARSKRTSVRLAQRAQIVLLAAQGLSALVGWWWMADQGLAISGWHWLTALAGMPVAALGVALVAAAVPAVSAYRTDVLSLLQTR